MLTQPYTKLPPDLLDALRRLRNSDHWDTLEEFADRYIENAAERLLQPLDNDATHRVRGEIIGVRSLLTELERLLIHARDRPEPDRPDEHTLLYGTPYFRRE